MRSPAAALTTAEDRGWAGGVGEPDGEFAGGELANAGELAADGGEEGVPGLGGDRGDVEAGKGEPGQASGEDGAHGWTEVAKFGRRRRGLRGRWIWVFAPGRVVAAIERCSRNAEEANPRTTDQCLK